MLLDVKHYERKQLKKFDVFFLGSDESSSCGRFGKTGSVC